MSAWQYTAWTTEGLKRGIVERDDSSAVAQWLETQGWVPVEVQKCRVAPRPAAAGKRRGGIRPIDLVMLTRQLEVLLRAGVPLVRALSVAAEQCQNPKLSFSLEQVRRAIEGGSLLSDALEAQPKIYPEIFVSLTRAGELGGLLPEMLARLGTLLEYDQETRERVRSATMYPTIVIVELCLAFVVLINFVLPRFVGLFKGLGAKLPLPTRILLAINDYAQAYGVYTVIGIAGAVSALVWYIRTPKGRDWWDGLKLKFPIVGPIFHKTAISRYARILSAMLAAGIPLLSGLEVSGRASGNRKVEAAAFRARAEVTGGRPLADSMGVSEVFSPMMLRMTAVGEETGNLDTLLERAAGYHDSEVDHLVKNLSTAIEPVMLVVLGGFVLFVALAIFMPMWNLMDAYKH